MTTAVERIEYHASPTCWDFHCDSAFVRGLLGPIGSGKSVACCWEIWRRANEQEPGVDGIRRSRWAVIRNTYRELTDTTIRTWSDWFPPDKVGHWDSQNNTHVISEGDLHIEVLFRALDRPDDVRKLLSLELTGAWINEAREVPRAVLDMLQGRVGRYPRKATGGPTWFGVIMDTNPPDSDHWWFRLFEEVKPADWALYRQPAGDSPEAENLENLPDGYYDRLKAGHSESWVDIYVRGNYGFTTDGKAVYPEYSDTIHCAREELDFDPDYPVIIGIDFGLTPAATISQDIGGQWRVLDELVTDDMGALRFGKQLGKYLRQHYPGCEFIVWGDPAGEQRAQTDERTPFDMLAATGINALPAPTNDFTIRRESVANRLSTLDAGRPAFLLSPRARQLRKAMMGGYQYKRVQVRGDERYQDKPDKGPLSHVAESLQYGMVGEGEGSAILGGGSQYADDWNNPINGRRRNKEPVFGYSRKR